METETFLIRKAILYKIKDKECTEQSVELYTVRKCNNRNRTSKKITRRNFQRNKLLENLLLYLN